jgi:hypothetical protein
MPKQGAETSLINLSVEEENLAGIPFAVLERRVGKRVGRIEIRGTKTLPDGTEAEVLWQVEGNNELGLPTEQDLDIFVALGVLTFRNNFAKTVAFSGREIAKILRIKNVHGKFYQRLKVAMDRFIPLRFRAVSTSERQEEVKWLNVFQEASFSLNRSTGKCTGTITWTDKLIRSMDSGFFRVLDAGRYMTLDGLTAKHLYRFLVVAFEKKDLVVIDTRKLALEHLGIFNLPHYFSRLMQTLEPAFDQLVRTQVVGSYHVVSNEEWKVALHRHPGYVPERKALTIQNPLASLESARQICQEVLEQAGFPGEIAADHCQQAGTHQHLYRLQRVGRLADEMKREQVMPHVVLSTLRRALELDVQRSEGLEVLDWCEIALEVCRYKRASGQAMKNLPGLLIKLARDPEMQERLVGKETAAAYRHRFQEREKAALRQAEQEEERQLILDYEKHRQQCAREALEAMQESTREVLLREKAEVLRQHDRLNRIAPELREQEIEQLVLQDLAKREAPPFERWKLRLRAQQAILPLIEYTA